MNRKATLLRVHSIENQAGHVILSGDTDGEPSEQAHRKRERDHVILSEETVGEGVWYTHLVR